MEKVHETQLIVRGYHMDMYQHVNNARYLELLEEARWRMIEERENPRIFAQNKWGFTVVNININYRSPAILADVLNIHTYIKRVGSKSVTLHQSITIQKDNDRIVADADVTFVMLDLNTGKPLKIEGELKKALIG